jgi:hypothetical protein
VRPLQRRAPWTKGPWKVAHSSLTSP